jgi:hypothetical protein
MASDNPALIQLRLLQQLEGSSGHTVVIGGSPLGVAVGAAGDAGGASRSALEGAPAKRAPRSR